MSAPPLLNAAGRRRSPATLPGYLAGRPPRNKGLRYPPDPPTVEEIVAVMREAGESTHGARLRALIVLLWRAGLRIQEALTLTEHDLEPGAGSALVRHGRREHTRNGKRLRIDGRPKRLSPISGTLGNQCYRLPWSGSGPTPWSGSGPTATSCWP
jgi:integrase